MLNLSQVWSFHRKDKSWSFTLLGSLTFLLIFCVSSSAQSSADLAATHDWVKSKAQDNAVRAALKRGPIDPCDWQNRPVDFDLFACIKEKIRGWLVMAKIARTDAQASPTVKNTIQKIVEGLRTVEEQWKALPQAEKNRQIAIRKETLQSVKRSGNNTEQVLQRIIADQGRSEETRATAGTILAGLKRGGGFGGQKCMIGCYCCCPDGCPCCEYSDPWEILGGAFR